MNAPVTRMPHSAPTGAAMDVAVEKNPRRRNIIIGLLATAVLAAAFGLWQLVPRGVAVPLADLRFASVTQGVFRDDVVMRATAEPLQSVMLDSVESGRVEEVFARDGAVVRQGELLFRLSNPQRRMELLARQTEHAQQISNLANLRVGFEANRTDHTRRLADLEFSTMQAEKAHARNVKLAGQGFISGVALEESADKLAQQKRALENERTATADEGAIKRDAMKQMESAIERVQSGLTLMNATVDALAVRSPTAGRLTDFRLQVGETVKQDQRIGRIDDPSRFKLAAQVDEFYLNRLALGRQGRVLLGEVTYPIEVARVYPQIKEGRFAIEMVFVKAQPPALSPGQGIEAQITLGDPQPALLLPTGAFLADSGGNWIFVLGADGASAERRDIKIGRRSNAQVEVLAGLAAGERVIVSAYGSFARATRLQFTK